MRYTTRRVGTGYTVQDTQTGRDVTDALPVDQARATARAYNRGLARRQARTRERVRRVLLKARQS